MTGAQVTIWKDCECCVDSQTTTLRFKTRSEGTGSGIINSLDVSLSPYSKGSNESSTQCV